ncbi:uncharacterized protein LOC142165818 [Nicotiana tabacum]|uniref:Uncharacterized protein LOC142165818 n=1 Tax=Nicotiana tabacum TaxID=4097 RepID=A0AC58S5Q3_TOBAC
MDFHLGVRKQGKRATRVGTLNHLKALKISSPSILIFMMNIIIWNIRGMKSKGATKRLNKLVNIHKADFVALQEPFLEANQIEGYKLKLGFDNATANKNGEIWIIAVYAKSTATKRNSLWSNLKEIHRSVDGPWTVLRDFNSIFAPEEKRGGILHKLSRSLDFLNCLEECELTDVGFTGNIFTWCNGSRRTRRISKILDRCSNNNDKVIKYFKFLNCWTQQPEFMELVKDSWAQEVHGNEQWIMQKKFKTLAKRLSTWSRQCIGNIFDKVQQIEAATRSMEEIYKENYSDTNRENLHKTQAEYIHWLKVEESILK